MMTYMADNVHQCDFPFMREEIKKQFGYLSFQCIFMNLDVVGIHILKSGQFIAIQYRGATKVGFIYEMEGLTNEKLLRIYQDVPENKNHLANWAKALVGKVDIYYPPKDNYVFVSDNFATTMEIVKALKRKNK